jgi:hypothetical protein
MRRHLWPDIPVFLVATALGLWLAHLGVVSGIFAQGCREDPVWCAYSDLRHDILPAETSLQKSAAIDDDHDGTGEYGFLSDLPGLDAPGSPLRRIYPDARAPFHFAIYLPDGPAGAITDGAGHTRGDPANAGLRARQFVAYAWADAPEDSRRVVAMDQSGAVWMRVVDTPGIPVPAWNALWTAAPTAATPQPAPGTWAGPVASDWRAVPR